MIKTLMLIILISNVSALILALISMYITNRAFKEYERKLKLLEDYKSRINKANKILQNILVISDWEHEGRYRPVKNTTVQDVYRAIIKLNELLETPYRQNYGLLQGSNKNE